MKYLVVLILMFITYTASSQKSKRVILSDLVSKKDWRTKIITDKGYKYINLNGRRYCLNPEFRPPCKSTLLNSDSLQQDTILGQHLESHNPRVYVILFIDTNGIITDSKWLIYDLSDFYNNYVKYILNKRKDYRFEAARVNGKKVNFILPISIFFSNNIVDCFYLNGYLPPTLK